MANRFEVFDVAVPAGTAKTAATETDTNFAQGTVTSVEIVIPDGHAGLTGITILQAHQQVIPWTAGAFIVGNAEVIRWDVAGFLDNGSWSVRCYNTDVYDHTFHLRFLVNENSATGPGTPGFIQTPLVIGPAAPVPAPAAFPTPPVPTP